MRTPVRSDLLSRLNRRSAPQDAYQKFSLKNQGAPISAWKSMLQGADGVYPIARYYQMYKSVKE